jgi:hypothetical protein
MDDRKIPSRGFQNVEHFFLSGGSKQDMESKAADAGIGNNLDAGQSDGPARTGQTNLNETEQHGSIPSRANEGIGSTVAKLEVLKRSCRGVALRTEGTNANNAWFRGAAAIIQEAISTLSEVISPAENNDS